MSVFTKLLLLASCLSMPTNGAPNMDNDETFQSLSHLRPWHISTNPTKNIGYPSLIASDSLRAPLSNSFAMASEWFHMPSGTANDGSSFASSGVVPYPTEGAPYQNSTSLYTKQGNGEGQSGLGNQCPPQQTVTQPPQTITLPAQIVTVHPAPETITITPQTQTETVTVTMTPQTQTTTVTVWMTVTADQAPGRQSPSNAANPQIAPVPAPHAQPSNTSIAPVFIYASTPAMVSPVVTTPNLFAPLTTGDEVPIANATSPVIPNLGTTATVPTTFPANNQTSPVVQQTSSSLALPITISTPIIAPYPYRNTTNQTLLLGSGSSHGFRRTGSGFARPTNRHFLSYFVSKFVTDTPISTTTIGPSLTREYFAGNGSSLLTPPSQDNATVFQLTAGSTTPPSPTREYFPDDGSSLLTPPTLADATASPTMEYFPDDGSSLLAPPAQANATSKSPVDGPTAPIVMPAVVGTSQILAGMGGFITTPPPPMIQFNTSTSIPPVSTPTPPQSPPTVQPNTSISLPPSTSSSQTSQPPTISTSRLCTNGTTTQYLITNVGPFPPPHV